MSEKAHRFWAYRSFIDRLATTVVLWWSLVCTLVAKYVSRQRLWNGSERVDSTGDKLVVLLKQGLPSLTEAILVGPLI